MRHFLTYLFLSSVMVVSHTHAQQTESTQQVSANDAALTAQENILFGDEDQPGRTIHSAIVTLVQSGATLDEAVSQTIANVTREDDALISGTARLVVGLNAEISANFMRNMVDLNTLTDSTKGSIEAFPGDAGEIIRLAVTLYPSFAQDVIDSAITTGEIEPNDALLAAISAGADPTTVSAATAAGANVAVTATPAGTGVGAGGTGGGDTTASTN